MAPENGSVFITSSVFLENSADVGGAILAMRGVILQIDNTIFSGNVAKQTGGAITCQTDVIAKMTDCRFTQNKAYITGAVMVASFSVDITTVRCNFTQNRPPQGSVIWLLKSRFNGLDTTFSKHSSNIIYTDSSDIILNACTFSNNSIMQSSIIEGTGKCYLVILKSGFEYNRIDGIISIYRC